MARTRGNSTPKSTRPLLTLVIGRLLLALFFPVIRWLVGEWLGNDFYSHGLLVPFISAFLAWRLWSRRPPTMTPSGNPWAGLALTVGGLGVYLLALHAARLLRGRPRDDRRSSPGWSGICWARRPCAGWPSRSCSSCS